jgi:hypothetical protein
MFGNVIVGSVRRRPPRVNLNEVIVSITKFFLNVTSPCRRDKAWAPNPYSG